MLQLGGEYEEESSGEQIERSSEDEVSVIMENVNALKETAITPLTQLAAERTKSLKEQGLEIADAAKLAKHEIEKAAGIDNIFSRPVDPRNASQTVNSSDSKDVQENRKKYALVLAGISQIAKDKGIHSSEVADALARDFKADGKFDGSSAGNPVLVENSAQVLDQDLWKTKLPQAMGNFVSSDRNKGGFSEANKPTVVEEPVREIEIKVPDKAKELARPIASALVIKGMQKGPVDVCIPMAIGEADAKGNIAPMDTELVVSLSVSFGLTAYRDSSCATSTESLTIPAYVGVSQFFVKTSTTGLFTVKGSDTFPGSSITATTFNVTFEAKSAEETDAIKNRLGSAVASKIRILIPPRLILDKCIPAQVVLLNSSGNPVPSQGQSISFNGDATRVEAFSDFECTRPITSYNLTNGKMGDPVFFKGKKSGDVTVTATGTSLESAEVKIKVEDPVPQSVPIPQPSSTPIVASQLQLFAREKMNSNTCVPIGVRHLNANQIPVPAPSSIEVRLSVSVGAPATQFFTAVDCSDASTLVNGTTAIPASRSDRVLYMKVAAPGSFTIKVTAVDPSSVLKEGSASVEVRSSLIQPVRPVADRVGFLFGPEIKIEIKISPFSCNPSQIAQFSSTGLNVSVENEGGLRISLKSTSNDIGFYSDKECKVPVTSSVIPKSQGVVNIYIKSIARKSEATLSATVSDSELKSGALKVSTY